MALEVPCCIRLEEVDCCDRIDLTYTLPHRVTQPDTAGAPRVVTVDVVIHVRIERCPGPYTLGDLVYTTTLLPGEKVRLFSTDRRSRFSFDSETKIAYRHARASEDHFYMSSFARDLSNLTVLEGGSSSSHAEGEWGAEMDSYYASIAFAGTAGGSIEGHYDDDSTHQFLRFLSKHAERTHYRSEMATRTSSSISIGEVSTRTHAEGETEDHFEAASRAFSNPNRCHAVTFFFYRISREQTVKFTLVAIDRRVRDPAAPTDIQSRPPVPPTGVSTMPTSVLGSATDRLEVEARAQESVARKVAVAAGTAGSAQASTAPLGTLFHAAPVGVRSQVIPDPVDPALRRAALDHVDKQLVNAGLLDPATGQASDQVIKEIAFERHFCLPTPGVLVKGCLDDCDICEPLLLQEMETDLEKKKLENELLKKQIELLEKSQEYRCCPVGSEEEVEGNGP